MEGFGDSSREWLGKVKLDRYRCWLRQWGITHFSSRQEIIVLIKRVNFQSVYRMHWMRSQGKRKTMALSLASNLSIWTTLLSVIILRTDIFNWLKYPLLLISLTRHQHLFKTLLYIELPYDPAIPLLGIYLKKTLIRKDTCTPMFIAALFTMTKIWKQTKCPSTDEWIKKMWYIYNKILLSHKKEWNNAIYSDMDGSRDYHIKWSKSDKKKYYMISLICGI